MPTFLDSSAHEDDQDDIIRDYENQDIEYDEKNFGDDQAEDDGNEDAEGTAPKRVDPSTSKKHIVRNPLPKLNTDRLKGPKGLQVIEKYFEGFKFHGKGHEKADLDRVMKRLEHWSHRLFPKLDFDDFLDRVEKLGTKKDLYVFIKKYRMDMITAEDGLILEEDIDDEETNKESEVVDEFDKLIAEQIDKQRELVKSLENSREENTLHESNEQNVHSIDDLSQPSAMPVNITKETNTVMPATELSDDVKERIERNRQQAIQRRLARLKALEEEAKRKKLEETNSGESQMENEEIS